MKTHSIRFKITAIAVAAVLTTILSISLLCYGTIQKETDRRSVEIMRLISQDARNTLDEYFVSVEQTVDMTSHEAADMLDSVVLVECGAVGSQAGQPRTPEQTARLDAYLAEHCEQIHHIFENVASRTHGVITYYYTISPEISETEHGFYYCRVGKAGFFARDPFVVSELDPDDPAHSGWYFTPVQRGRPSWIGPFPATSLNDMLICSYVVPIYNSGTLIGVIGMDIALDTLIAQVSPIRVYETGFATLCDSEGHLYYHPTLKQGMIPALTKLSVSQELLQNQDSGSTLIRYEINGERRQMSFVTLRNGLKLIVSAPVREINASWLRLLRIVVLVTAVVTAFYAVLLMFTMRLVTMPLLRLTAASKRLAASDFDVELPYHGKDEVGELTDAFRLMRDQQRSYIADLNRRINTDDLTGLPNLRHFFELAEDAKDDLIHNGKLPAMLYFNLIGMKHFNRQYGFDQGDRLLRAAAGILESRYGRNNICRIGQDEFAAVTDAAGLEKDLPALFAELQSINGGRSLPVRVGVYHGRGEQVSVSVACDRAKYAGELLRGTFVSGYRYFEREMQLQVEKQRYVVNHLDQAIERRWIQVYYQPIIRAGNGKICDEEALARWNDPSMGFLSPADFIPALENAGLIYKLDLYVLDQVLERIRLQRQSGLAVVPCSVNLSRADFDACDIVEEICRRVDAAGVRHDKITIEITESIIATEFDYMKEQVARFQSLGFPVWMDDFGSGYSSLDVLQSIRFDLLKFDMSFMRKLDEGEDGKIILSKLMEMATALGVDTLCEGVETESQCRFLQEIGCSKLQGYYYSKPLSLADVFERARQTGGANYENPDETGYYEAVGRVNLFDLGVIATDDSGAFRHSFSTLPMSIIEIRDDMSRFMRSNQSYRDFIQRFYALDLAKLGAVFTRNESPFMLNVLKTCSEPGGRSFFDERMPDGSVVHSFARRVGYNPVTGNTAVAVAVLSISEADEATSYADIARALASDYYNIYVVDLDTEQFIEYRSTVGGEELAMERHGQQFFASVKRDAATRIYGEDRDSFLNVFTKANVIRELDEQGVFTATYRLVDSGLPLYANMKVTRMQGGKRIILGISIIDAQMKQKEAEERARQEQIAFGRIAALSGDYIAMYSVHPKTGAYTEYSALPEYKSYGLAETGEDFFGKLQDNAALAVAPADLPLYRKAVTKENIMREIHRNGLFVFRYHLVLKGQTRPVSLRAALVKEPDGEKFIFGINSVDEVK